MENCERVRGEESVDRNSPCMRKVLSNWSVATGLISVRRLTYRPTTSGALLNPRILRRGQEMIPEDYFSSAPIRDQTMEE